MSYMEWKKKRLEIAQSMRESSLAVRRQYVMPGTELQPSRFIVATMLVDMASDPFHNGCPVSVFVKSHGSGRSDHDVTEYTTYELEFLIFIQQLVERWTRGEIPELPAEKEVLETFKPRWFEGQIRPGKVWTEDEE